MTSSGLTHTCADGLLHQFLCPLMLKSFTQHRLKPSINSFIPHTSYYSMKRNYAVMKFSHAFESENDNVLESGPLLLKSWVDVSIHGIEDDHRVPLMQLKYYSDRNNSLYSIKERFNVKSNVAAIVAPEFLTFQDIEKELMIGVLMVVLIGISLLIFCIAVLRISPKIVKKKKKQ